MEILSESIKLDQITTTEENKTLKKLFLPVRGFLADKRVSPTPSNPQKSVTPDPMLPISPPTSKPIYTIASDTAEIKAPPP